MTLTAAPAIADLSRFIPDLRSRRREGVLGELVDVAARSGAVRARGPLIAIVRLRERVVPAARVQDAAVQGARSLAIVRPFLAVGRSSRGVEWPGRDGDVVHLVVLALAPAEWNDERFHGLLARAGALVRLQRQRQRLITGGTDAALADLLREVAPS